MQHNSVQVLHRARQQRKTNPNVQALVLLNCHRAILNFNPGSHVWTSSLAVTLSPRGEICSLGGMFTPSFTPRGEHSLLFGRMEGWTENYTPPPGDNFTPRGQNLPLGPKFAPWGEVKNVPLLAHHEINLYGNGSAELVCFPWKMIYWRQINFNCIDMFLFWTAPISSLLNFSGKFKDAT
jgi:hypothetical protein